MEREESIREVAESLIRQDVEESAELVQAHGRGALALIEEAAKTSWIARWVAAIAPLILRVMRSAKLPTDRGPIEVGFDVQNPRLKAYFRDYVVELSGNVAETTREQVTRAIQEGLGGGESVPKIADRVRAAGEEFGPSRANLIARNETLKASKGASSIQARESGVVKSRTWRDSGDSRVRPEHKLLDGVTVGIDEPYPNGEMVPGENTVNCRCSERYSIDYEALRGRTA